MSIRRLAWSISEPGISIRRPDGSKHPIRWASQAVASTSTPMSGTARWSQPTRADSHVRSAPVAAVLEVAVEVSVLPVGSQHCGNRSSSPVRQESRLHQSAQRIGELVQQIRLLAELPYVKERRKRFRMQRPRHQMASSSTRIRISRSTVHLTMGIKSELTGGAYSYERAPKVGPARRSSTTKMTRVTI